MSWPRIIFSYGVFLLLAHASGADVMIQLNINQPIYDVSEKFISFTMKPEDMFKALDSSNRKIITRMASMLSHSHIKFVGDYNFAAKTEGIRLRNPTKIVWKGFNKWTKAVNWSMIIPVPYKPGNWDPMETLKFLNISQMVGIDEAIWQLGTDFGFSRASDYVSELKTFNVMVDSFRQSAMNWQAMGADISAGSSPEETRRYVDMSRDLNVAYGWIESNDLFSSNNIDSHMDRQDPALRVLFKQNVPVWLSLPTKKTLLMHMEDDEVSDGLRWAQTMGEAANMGFDSIFKPLTLDDLERPKYGFYATVLFKKIMGSRVYPARPMALFGRSNKLYTHCANMVSGGLAFMVVNRQDEPLQIAIRSMNKLQDTEVWQYALTMENGRVMLNDERLYLNSTLMPEVRRKHSMSMLQLQTPGSSVSFWVLPNANLEHCHFTEVDIPAMPASHSVQKTKRYSSSDRLLKELIKESTKSSHSPSFPLSGLISRHRRSVNNEDRLKRFVLEGAKDEVKPLANLAGSLVQELKTPFKRGIYSPDRRMAAIEWLSNIFKEPLSLDLPLLKRNARQSASQKGPFFMTRDGKKTTFTKKITEIKKPEKKTNKLIPDDQEFDEEKFFKNVGTQPEPDYVRVPEGDIFLSNIDSVNGDEHDEPEDLVAIETTKFNKDRTQKKKIVSEMKPLRLLPTEFFEAMPPKHVQPLPTDANFGSPLNTVLFSDLFGENKFGRDFDLKQGSLNEDDMVKAHIEMTQNVLGNKGTPQHNAQRNSNAAANGPENEATNNGKLDEAPWWDLSSKRLRRSLDGPYTAANTWRSNLISKDDDPMTAANELSPVRLRHFEHKVEEVVRSTNNNNNDKNEDYDEISVGKKIVKTFKDQFTKLVGIFSHHANEWYNTLTKQLDNVLEETTTTATNQVA